MRKMNKNEKGFLFMLPLIISFIVMLVYTAMQVPYIVGISIFIAIIFISALYGAYLQNEYESDNKE